MTTFSSDEMFFNDGPPMQAAFNLRPALEALEAAMVKVDQCMATIRPLVEKNRDLLGAFKTGREVKDGIGSMHDTIEFVQRSVYK